MEKTMGLLQFGDFRARYATTTALFSMKIDENIAFWGCSCPYLLQYTWRARETYDLAHLRSSRGRRAVRNSGFARQAYGLPRGRARRPVRLDQKKNGGAQAADTHAGIRFLCQGHPAAINHCCYQPTTKRRTNGNVLPVKF